MTSGSHNVSRLSSLVAIKGCPKYPAWPIWLLAYLYPAAPWPLFIIDLHFWRAPVKRITRFMGRCAMALIIWPLILCAGAQFARAAFHHSLGTSIRLRALDKNLFPRCCKVMYETDGRGNAVRAGFFVVAFVAGVLSVILKPFCSILVFNFLDIWWHVNPYKHTTATQCKS